jgi:hypothetical protein
LDLSLVPSDFLKVLNSGLNKYKQYDKCGLSLQIDDLPDTDEGNYIKHHEGKYWVKSLAGGYFDSPVDTTFALYREGVKEYNHNGIRSARPYTAKHIPWYYSDINLLPEDEQYYLKTANESSSGKKRLVK